MITVNDGYFSLIFSDSCTVAVVKVKNHYKTDIFKHKKKA